MVKVFEYIKLSLMPELYWQRSQAQNVEVESRYILFNWIFFHVAKLCFEYQFISRVLISWSISDGIFDPIENECAKFSNKIMKRKEWSFCMNVFWVVSVINKTTTWIECKHALLKLRLANAENLLLYKNAFLFFFTSFLRHCITLVLDSKKKFRDENFNICLFLIFSEFPFCSL